MLFCSFAWPHHVLKFHELRSMPLPTFHFFKMNLWSLNGNKWYTKPTLFLGTKFHIIVIFWVKDEYFITILFVFENNHPKGGNLGWFCKMSILGKDLLWGQVLIICHHLFSNLFWDACYWHSNMRLKTKLHQIIFCLEKKVCLNLIMHVNLQWKWQMICTRYEHWSYFELSPHVDLTSSYNTWWTLCLA